MWLMTHLAICELPRVTRRERGLDCLSALRTRCRHLSVEGTVSEGREAADTAVRQMEVRAEDALETAASLLRIGEKQHTLMR